MTIQPETIRNEHFQKKTKEVSWKIQAKTIHYATERGGRWEPERVSVEVATGSSDGLRLESPSGSGQTRGRNDLKRSQLKMFQN